MATINDVAEKAGVSVTTVSRVLNNRGYISEKTRQKVYQVMDELKYQPNELARSLLRKHSNVLGLIIPSVAHPFFGELANEIESVAYQHGFKLLLCNSQFDSAKEREYIDMMRRNRVDGMILGSHTLEIGDYTNLNYPLVTIDRRIGDIPFVASDNENGGALAARLLIAKGCRKLGHLAGNMKLDMLSNLRTTGFEREARQEGVKFVTYQTELDVFDEQIYNEIIRKMFTEHPDIDGVFTTSDLMALFVMKWCRTVGKEVPRDVRVIGYDDIPAASWYMPGLSTIRQPIKDMARRAVELLLEQMEDKPVERETILPVELVEREST
ncbi:LacI family DNA-binding transcriptional regulator [Paenibacillus sp. BAC0078]